MHYSSMNFDDEKVVDILIPLKILFHDFIVDALEHLQILKQDLQRGNPVLYHNTAYKVQHWFTNNIIQTRERKGVLLGKLHNHIPDAIWEEDYGELFSFKRIVQDYSESFYRGYLRKEIDDLVETALENVKAQYSPVSV